MGKWKKAVAALAAVPMLMALAPAANAVIGYHRFIGRTAGAGSSLKSNAKASADSDLLASLDFNNVTASALVPSPMRQPAPRQPSTVPPQ
mgnify:CR=1 FL=1